MTNDVFHEKTVGKARLVFFQDGSDFSPLFFNHCAVVHFDHFKSSPTKDWFFNQRKKKEKNGMKIVGERKRWKKKMEEKEKTERKKKVKKCFE